MHMQLFLQEINSTVPLGALLIVSVVDWSTGLMASYITKTTNSKIGMNGIFRKVMMYLALVAVGVVSYSFEQYHWVLDVFMLFFIVNELISVLENLVESGIRLPQGILELFKKEREQYEERKTKE